MATNGDWTSDKYVQNWFELLGNERTIKNYKNDFPKFLAYIQENTEYKTPTEIINSRLQQLTTQDLLKRRFWEQQVVKYKNSLEEKNLRMATIHGHIRTVMSFFSKNGVKLLFSRGELKINPSEKDKVDREWIPSNEEVRLLYRLCDNARDRAILLTLYQSGFSEVDAASMQIQDFPFYDENSDWAIASNFDLYHKRRREKTNQWQQTCLSREVLEEIRIMLQGRGFPSEGYLFVSFRGEQLGVRGINDMLKGVVTKAFNGKVKLWKTKHLRDAFMNGLLQAKLTQEIKDAMVGHKRQGARNDYAITELTIKTAYAEAFKYLTINGYGKQSRKVEELGKQVQQLTLQMASVMELFDTLLTDDQKRFAALEAAKRVSTMTPEKLIRIENMLKLFGQRDDSNNKDKQE
ncbi:MAG: tyrosine-type recombinase/integrase [Candidatus Bathyarchaeota archaeon]|nr:tyrosine-type recombinase/integrase [Candidatus Bathyarchaeota archaeon]